MTALHEFSPGEPVKNAHDLGPGSNTGQKGQPAPVRQHAVTVDFLTVVFNRDRLEAARKLNLRYLLQWIFGLDPRDVFMGQLHAKRWQFYRSSAPIIDANGELVGRFGCEGNGDTMCVSLSGAACRYIRNWRHVEVNLQLVGARITRCDIAYDDYDGVLGTVRDHEALARANMSDTGGCLLFGSGPGAPPKTRFMDDHGNGDGCTLYVGGKGHKQLCIYEKGKQLGVCESPWVRYEARLYGKHAELPLDMLTHPMRYLRGSYAYMDRLLARVGQGIATAVKIAKRTVEATAEAMVRWAHRQVGPTLHCLREALGDQFGDFVVNHLAREGLPSRFKRACKAADLPAYVRETLVKREIPCPL
ncbi:hypothetical protein NB688_002858 [Xanthomonas sacchari]|uniref:Replication initiation protein-like C-terminal domain-containing protein n=1 Tax=Xanthomonas sacchari TaxID=56458 RepID=A0ABT3DWD6_9XANT|nr:replication initiation factor domain-containing protein [Xanthomonas sacchari]MCW0399803.1 hypothetical protein [Xanthomonas sacchari]MCW0420692.1 hypothetical protein [Xanthomonas sacchari]UYK74737.1 replication initiation factor domain-containing protein [Xanthomonas sacchari]